MNDSGSRVGDALKAAEQVAVVSLAFELADGTARAIIMNRSNRSPGGWCHIRDEIDSSFGRSIRFALRYLELRGDAIPDFRMVRDPEKPNRVRFEDKR